jgi:D-lactate dehydrogenase
LWLKHDRNFGSSIQGSACREHNFSISGLEGFDIRGKVIGIIGTGNIGKITAEILKGFGPSRLLGNDAYPSEELK